MIEHDLQVDGELEYPLLSWASLAEYNSHLHGDLDGACDKLIQ